MDFKLEISNLSPYRETKLRKADGKVFFGLWKSPIIFLDGDENQVRVSERDRGRLDGLAHRELGTRELAWAIAMVNKIDYVPRDIIPGRVLVIPKEIRVQEALQKVTGGR